MKRTCSVLLDEDELKGLYRIPETHRTGSHRAAPDAAYRDSAVSEDKGSSNLSAFLPLLLFAAMGVGGFVLLQKNKKKSQQEKPDPDADYPEEDDFRASG